MAASPPGSHPRFPQGLLVPSLLSTPRGTDLHGSLCRGRLHGRILRSEGFRQVESGSMLMRPKQAISQLLCPFQIFISQPCCSSLSSGLYPKTAFDLVLTMAAV